MSYLGGTQKLHHGLHQFKMFKLEVGELSQNDPEVQHAFKLLIRKFEREHMGKEPTKKQMEGILKRSMNKAYSLKFKKSKGGNVKVKYAPVPKSLKAEPLPYHERFPETFSITQKNLLPYYSSHLRKSYKTAPYVLKEEEIEGRPFETKLERAVREAIGKKRGRPSNKEVVEREKRNEFLRDIESYSLPKKETGKRARKTKGEITSEEYPDSLIDLHKLQLFHDKNFEELRNILEYEEKKEGKNPEEFLRKIQEIEEIQNNEREKLRLIEDEIGRTLDENEEEVIREALEEIAREELGKSKKKWKPTKPSEYKNKEALIELDTEDLDNAEEKVKEIHRNLMDFDELHKKVGARSKAVKEQREIIQKAYTLALQERKQLKEKYDEPTKSKSKSKKRK
jgi:hypothetical protein